MKLHRYLMTLFFLFMLGNFSCGRGYDLGRLGDGFADTEEVKNQDDEEQTNEDEAEQPTATGSADYFFKFSAIQGANRAFAHGDVFTVEYEVKNQGDTFGGTYTVTAILLNSACNNSGGNWCIVGQVTEQPVLSSLATSGLKTISFPVRKEIGTSNEVIVKLLLDVSPSEPIERQFNDHIDIEAVSVAGRPDLTIVNAAFDQHAQNFNSSMVSYAVMNQGSAATNGSGIHFTHEAYLSVENSPNAAMLPGSKIVNTNSTMLNVNATTNETLWTINNFFSGSPNLPPEGNLYAIIKVDVNNSQIEIDENNNIFVLPIR